MSEIVVITGGTAGVGRATARRFLRAGAKVAVLARGEDGLRATRAEGALAIQCDVSDPEAVERAASQVEAELGPIDIWINNAMVTVFGRFTAIPEEQYRRVTDVTYLGFVWGTRAALARMTPRNRGTIVQVGSALAYRSIPLQSAYCAAKHAIVGFTDSLRSELLHDGVDVKLTCVHLPAVDTPQFDWCENHMPYEAQPVPPIFEPEIIADALYRVAHHPTRETYLGWPAIKAILGQEVAPGLADRYLARHGFDSQYTDQKRDASRPRNLFEPVAGDHGARGRFSSRARKHDRVAAASVRLGAAGVRATAMIAGLAAAFAMWRVVRAVM